MHSHRFSKWHVLFLLIKKENFHKSCTLLRGPDCDEEQKHLWEDSLKNCGSFIYKNLKYQFSNYKWQNGSQFCYFLKRSKLILNFEFKNVF